jgi:hypothetical protein
MRKKIEIIAFVVIISKIFITGVLTTISSFCQFYEYDQPALTEKINGNIMYSNFVFTYTGFDTGYGFFAPNVSSNFIILSKNSDKIYLSEDLLQSNEGKMRFSSLNDIFFKNFGKEKDKGKMQVNKIILSRINKMFEKKYNSKFTTTAYLYDHPKLEETDKKGRLIKIDEIK